MSLDAQIAVSHSISIRNGKEGDSCVHLLWGLKAVNGKREKMPHCKLCGVSKYVCAELFAEDFKEFLLRIAINTNSAESTNVLSLCIAR